MPRVETFGEQPGLDLLRQQGRTITGTARLAGLSPTHVRLALRGEAVPNDETRERLPAFMGCEITDLFDDRVLDRRPRPVHGYAKGPRRNAGVGHD